MSGIIGIWNLDGRPVEKALLSKLSATLAHRGPDGEGFWIQGPVGLACQLMRVTPESVAETQPLVHSSGITLVFDGRLDNRVELLAALNGSPGISADSPDPAFVLAAYDVFGDQFPERLNGDFVLGLLDPNRGQLLLARDAIGVRPLYYCRQGDTFLFASEIKTILAHPQVPARPNDDMLAAFLLGDRGQHCHGMTFFEGIACLPPAHLAIFKPETFLTRRYWDFDPARRVRFGSFQEYGEAFRHHFDEAVRRRLRSASPVAVSVSGGLDSSSIFCLAETFKRRDPSRYARVLGISHTSADGAPSDEKAFLLEIERAYGSAIERLPMGTPGLLDGCREEVWHVEAPFLDVQWNVTHKMLHSVHQRGARVLLGGHWGDQMLVDQAYLIDLFHRLAWGEMWAHLKEFSRWNTDVAPNHFKRLFFRQLLRCYAPDALLSLCRRVKAKLVQATATQRCYTEPFQARAGRHVPKQTSIGSFVTAHFRSLYQEVRSRYHVLCMEWNNQAASMHGIEMAFPFLDRDLLYFLMGIPGEMQTWRGIPKALLREAMRGVIPSPIAERRWKADFTDAANAGMELEYPQLLRSLEEGRMAVLFGYVDEDVMREELARLRSRIGGRDCLVTWSLRDLLGLELWLQVFFNEKPTNKELTEPCKSRLSTMTLAGTV